MARTSIAMVLIAVLIQTAFAAKLMNVDSLADNEEKETPLKRTSDYYEYMHQGGCNDYHEYCQLWASNGQCYNNMEYMYSTCPYSCNTCSGGMYYKRDATSNFGYNPPRTRDDSRKEVGSDNSKRMYGFGNFSQDGCTGSRTFSLDGHGHIHEDTIGHQAHVKLNQNKYGKEQRFICQRFERMISARNTRTKAT